MVLIRSSASISKPPTYRLIGLQCCLTALATLVAWGVFGQHAAISAFLGGLIVVIPAAYFSWRAFAYNQTRSAAKVLGSFYQAELGKLLLTAFLFAAVFKLFSPLNDAALFATFGTVLMGGLLASATLLSAKQTNN